MGDKYRGYHFPTLKAIVSHILMQCEFTKTGCLEWKGHRHRKGYGCVRFIGKMRKCHHLIYELYKGPIPAEMHVLHQCDHPWCQNPAHLYAGTNAQNIQDKIARERSGKKLNIAKVRRIQAMLSEGIKQTRIAKQFGVTQQIVSRIKTGSRWAHVQNIGGAESVTKSLDSVF